MSSLLVTLEVIAQDNKNHVWLHELPCGVLVEVTYKPTVEHGKQVEPWAPELEYHHRAWSVYWDHQDSRIARQAERGWRYLSRPEAVLLVDEGATPEQIDARRAELAEEVFARIKANAAANPEEKKYHQMRQERRIRGGI